MGIGVLMLQMLLKIHLGVLVKVVGMDACRREMQGTRKVL